MNIELMKLYKKWNTEAEELVSDINPDNVRVIDVMKQSEAEGLRKAAADILELIYK